MSKYTNEQIIAAAEAAVRDRGEDYVYPRTYGSEKSCVYSWGDEPACIVGYIIHAIDPEAFMKLKAWDDVGGTLERGTGVGAACHDEVIDLTNGQKRALESAQNGQDLGEAWGTAYLTIKNGLS